MSAERSMLRAISETPDDDHLRRVYGDWLSERGDPRGELIHLQCELATLPARDPRAARIREREQALLREHASRMGPFYDPRFAWSFDRGFVSGVGHRGVFHKERKSDAVWVRLFPDRTGLYIVTGKGGLADIVANWFVKGHEHSTPLTYTLEPQGARVRIAAIGKRNSFTAELTAHWLDITMRGQKRSTRLLLEGKRADSRYS